MSNEIALDRTDRAIIAELVLDGRLTNVELASKVGLTPAPCLRRLRRLEEEGVITGYRATLAPRAVGRAFCVYVSVQIAVRSNEVVQEFERTVASYAEVTELRRVYGELDYLMRVDVADSDAYERFLTTRMNPLPAVRRMVSHPTMKTIKTSDQRPA
ncbi:Lrp/AsnC family transcriptional regulator [Litorihabitans aurantiacus]|nr:Lrp/AsnC family transcriptional regulator [Litorihabitans aurantiacus]